MTPLLAGAPQAVIREFSQQRAQRGRYVSAASAYAVSRSLRFNSADSAYLSRTPASAGNRKTWTWSAWVKRGTLSSHQWLLGGGASGTNSDDIYFGTDDTLTISSYYGSTQFQLTLTRKFRDVASWYHIVLAVDTTIASPSSDRVKIYVNGENQTTFDTAAYPAQDFQFSYFNNTSQQLIGSSRFGTPGNYLNGYLANIHFIDGYAYDPSYFGQTNTTTGAWDPKTYSGSYGSNGFHLDFADNSDNTASTLGKDTSPNGNNWTPNNLVVAPTTIYSNYVTNQYSLYNYTSSINLDPTAAKYLFDGGTSVSVVDWNGVYNVTVSPPYRLEFIPPAPISFTSQVRVYSVGNPGSPYNVRIAVDLGSGYGSTIPVIQNNWVTVATGSGQLHKLKALADQNGTGMSAIEIDGVILTQRLGADVDSLIDSPTNGSQTDTGLGGEVVGNYATFNALALNGNTLSNGNLNYLAGSANKPTLTTIGIPNTGKWYVEFTDVDGTAGSFIAGVGIASVSVSSFLGLDANGWGYQTHPSNAGYYNSGVFTTTGRINGAGSNTIVGIAIDRDAQKIWFSVNGTFVNSGAPASGTNAQYSNLPTSGELFPGASTGSNQNIVYNAGQRAFAYTAPSGFKALCTANLPTPTIANGATVMDVVLWTGNNTDDRVITTSFSPEFLWVKRRDSSSSHRLTDVVRGNGKILYSELTDAEATETTSIKSLGSTGFTLGTSVGVNATSGTYVGWYWDAGSSTASNPDGSITSQVRANTTAGFSIVTWSYGSSDATVGHGLGVAPGMIIAKGRTSGLYGAGQWIVYHSGMGANKYIYLSSTNAAGTNIAGVFDGNSSTVFEVNSGLFPASLDYVAYCWAPVAGYSAFGSYTGNGSTDGPFVYTGFRPRWIMFKRTDTTANWLLIDTARDSYNAAAKHLHPDLSNAEATGSPPWADILSNGFKLRNSYGETNASSGTYIYAAFAESPFNYSRAR